MTAENGERKLCIICSKGTLDMAYPGLVLANAALMEGISTEYSMLILKEMRKDY